MFEGSQEMDPGRDEIDLEALLAADEAAINDQGFSARVMAGVALRVPVGALRTANNPAYGV